MIRALKKAKWCGTHRITITARPPASLPHCLRSTRRRPPPAPGCWRKCPKPAIVPFVPRRKPDGKGYELIILPPECLPAAGRRGNHRRVDEQDRCEQCIMMAPEQYMWLHRRFKTRPRRHAPPVIDPFPAALIPAGSLRPCFRLSFSFKSSRPLRHLFLRRIISRLIFSLLFTVPLHLMWIPYVAYRNPH